MEPRRGQASRWPWAWIAVAIPALAELIVGGYRIGVPSLWRDEAATISGSQRSLPAIATMMRHEDAVHAPYYVLMHPVIALGGTSATVLRLPSLIAMTLAVGLTAALGRRLAQASGLPGATALGIVAGLALTAVPLTTRYAQEARPYALATLFAVAASYAFVRALGSPLRRWWVLYAVALLLAGLFDLFAALIAVAHGISMIWLSRARGEKPAVASSAAGRRPRVAGRLRRGRRGAEPGDHAQRWPVGSAELGQAAGSRHARGARPRLRRGHGGAPGRGRPRLAGMRRRARGPR